MRHPSKRTCALFLLVAAALASCSRADNAPKTPLGQLAFAADTTRAEPDALPKAAQAELARGNAEFRAGRYEAALTAYRAAGRAASGNVAPYYGIYMAAQKLGKTALADSASKLIRVLGAPALSDSEMRRVHAGGGKQ